MNEPLDLENLRHWVRERRRELDLSHLEIQQLGGPSTTTMTKIEAGRGPAPRRDVVKRLEHVLGWSQGSVRRILAGGSPDVVAGGSEGPGRLAGLIEDYLRADGATDAEVAAYVGVDVQTIAVWRAHRLKSPPEIETLRRLASFLRVDELLVFDAALIDAGYGPRYGTDIPHESTA